MYYTTQIEVENPKDQVLSTYLPSVYYGTDFHNLWTETLRYLTWEVGTPLDLQQISFMVKP